MQSIVVTSIVAQAPKPDFTNTWGGKIFLLVVGALLTLGVTLYVNRRTALRARRRLTWSVAIDSQVLTIPTDVREKVSISYEGHTIADLATVHCTIMNDSLQGVRNHQLRFPAPESGRILDFSVKPEPEPERGYEDDSDPSSLDVVRIIKIGYLGPTETISFLIVTSGGDWLRWTGPRSSNPTEDIEFDKRDVAQQVDDREHVRPFVFWAVILSFQSSILGFLPHVNLDLLPSPAGLISAIIFIFFLLPHLGAISRLVATAASNAAQRQRGSVQIWGGSKSVILYDATSSAEHGIMIYPPPEADAASDVAGEPHDTH
jgi:hypothetical protein